jgi:hypothetical protein
MINEQNEFFDNVLIKLKRKYSKEEVLSAVIKQNSEYEVEIGKLKSEIDFINYTHKKECEELKKSHKKELSKLKSDLKQELNIEIQKEFKESKLRLENIEQKKVISNLRKTISDLISKSNAKNGN